LGPAPTAGPVAGPGCGPAPDLFARPGVAADPRVDTGPAVGALPGAGWAARGGAVEVGPFPSEAIAEGVAGTAPETGCTVAGAAVETEDGRDWSAVFG